MIQARGIDLPRRGATGAWTVAVRSRPDRVDHCVCPPRKPGLTGMVHGAPAQSRQPHQAILTNDSPMVDAEGTPCRRQHVAGAADDGLMLDVDQVAMMQEGAETVLLDAAVHDWACSIAACCSASREFSKLPEPVNASSRT